VHGVVAGLLVRTTGNFQQSGKVTATFRAMLVAIASISMLVGGIGAMTIKPVMVT
jgi:putative ABC transport system permease protein